MNIQHHYLKIKTKYYQAIVKGKKKFELRKNDRDFKVHDIIYLQEIVNDIKIGRVLVFKIKYIFYGGDFGLDKDYCILNW